MERLKAGKIVYDGPATGLETKQLIDIYGPEFEDVFWEGAPKWIGARRTLERSICGLAAVWGLGPLTLAALQSRKAGLLGQMRPKELVFSILSAEQPGVHGSALAAKLLDDMSAQIGVKVKPEVLLFQLHLPGRSHALQAGPGRLAVSPAGPRRRRAPRTPRFWARVIDAGVATRPMRSVVIVRKGSGITLDSSILACGQEVLLRPG